jgi:hypothetical protein
MKQEPTRAASRREAMIRTEIAADLRQELFRRSELVNAYNIRPWQHWTNSKWYAEIVEQTIIELRMWDSFSITYVR